MAMSRRVIRICEWCGGDTLTNGELNPVEKFGCTVVKNAQAPLTDKWDHHHWLCVSCGTDAGSSYVRWRNLCTGDLRAAVAMEGLRGNPDHGASGVDASG